MATVYLAQDRKLGRAVALKVLRPELAVALGGDRFQREIETTAQLTHPHILPLLDSGEADGTLFYVMPFVEGESLRDRLERERQLPLAEALQISREVADALGYAHTRGIIHRDIKPENILLCAGHAVVADFGIARALSAAGEERLTATGLAVGTPAYMSPEQAAGGGKLDGRSDIYALGCVLYEMLSGETPYTGPTPQAILAKKLCEPLPRISVVRETVLPEVEAALNKALARTPADRWPTATEFAAALGAANAPAHRRTDVPGHWRTDVPGHRRTGAPWLARAGWLVAAVVLVAVAGGVAIQTGVLQPSRAPSGGAEEPLRSVAVLPFTSLGDTAQAYFGDGFTNAVTDALVRVEGLRVPESGRVFAYRGRDVREAGRDLGVRTVVTGSVQVAAGRLRVWAQLVNVEDGTSVWSHQYNCDMAGVFPTQDSIATGIVEALRVRVARAAGAAVGRGVLTRDPEAYQLYLRGQQAAARGAFEQGRALYEQALARDSTFADAWVALAEAYSHDPTLSMPETAAGMRRAVERAIELDSLNGHAYALRSLLHGGDWNWERARADMERAVRLSPASPDVHRRYTQFLFIVGEPDSALAWARRSVALDPANSLAYSALASAFVFAGMPDSARTAAEHALVLDSTAYFNHQILAQLYAASGLHAEAEREIEIFLRAGERSGDPWGPMLAAYAYRVMGRPERARAMLRRLEELSRRQPVEAGVMAGARLAVGDRAGALDLLEESARNHEDSVISMLINWLPGLAGDPRYEAVHRRVFGDIPAPRGSPSHRLRAP